MRSMDDGPRMFAWLKARRKRRRVDGWSHPARRVGASTPVSALQSLDSVNVTNGSIGSRATLDSGLRQVVTHA